MPRKSGSGPVRILVLAGGVGAARLIRGLHGLVPDEALTIVVNTGDDDEFYGLSVCPDIDTILYTLGGLSDPKKGWGVAGDTFEALQALGRYHDQPWFQLGDRDLATHIFRTDLLRQGRRLSQVTARQREALGVGPTVLPMSDDPVRTVIQTTRGRRSFQEYLVRDRTRETVRAIRYTGARKARPAPGVLRAIARAHLVIVAPSNPLVSIGPILAVPGIRDALGRSSAVAVAVSPLIGGRPVKGPADRMLRSLGHGRTPTAISHFYRDFLDGIVIDEADARHLPKLEGEGLSAVATPTLMDTLGRSRAVARKVLRLGDTLRGVATRSR